MGLPGKPRILSFADFARQRLIELEAGEVGGKVSNRLLALGIENLIWLVMYRTEDGESVYYARRDQFEGDGREVSEYSQLVGQMQRPLRRVTELLGLRYGSDEVGEMLGRRWWRDTVEASVAVIDEWLDKGGKVVLFPAPVEVLDKKLEMPNADRSPITAYEIEHVLERCRGGDTDRVIWVFSVFTQAALQYLVGMSKLRGLELDASWGEIR